MTAEFLDPDVQARFDAGGYVVERLLTPEAATALGRRFDTLAAGAATGFVTTLRDRTLAENLAISAEIEAVLLPAIAAVAPRYVPIGATFLAKGAGPDGVLTVHQDWVSVDERTSHSVNVWCALNDVPVEMGPLEVVAGSHLWFESYRSPTIPSVQVPFDDETNRLLTPLPVQAGEAVFYDHRLLHGSRENRTGRPRLVAQVGMRPESAPLTMCFATDDGRIERRHVDPSAFFSGFDYESGAALDRPGRVVDVVDARPLAEHDVSERMRREVAQATVAASRARTPASTVPPTGADERPRDRLWRRVRNICSR